MNRYFYIDNEGRQKGTFSPQELKSENIRRDTLVWTQGMSEWTRASEVGELTFLFADSSGYYPPQSGQQMPMPPAQPTHAGQQTVATAPRSWLIESILATILPFVLCGSIFSLLGIIGIVNASKVESLYARGDYEGSLEASRQAGRWTKIALWICVGWIILYVLFFVMIIALGLSLSDIGEVFDGSGYSI